MSYIRPYPLPHHYSELDNLKRYRMSDDVPEEPDGKWIVVIACAFVAVCLLAIKFGR